MGKTSVIIPARNEKYLVPTVEDVFRNARGDETEVIAVLEGYYPEGWKELVAKHPKLQTIHHSEPKGMRPSINEAAASAISRGAKYLFKLDAHCSLEEGFDVKLQADCEPNWVVVPRRKRLDPETWGFKDTNKPDIDYHYLSFPDDVNDFGGPGLNGKVWEERALERKDILIDDEMSSQGSGWFMHASYFTELELMDDVNYGTFWNEFQEIGNKCWLSGGRVVINKKTWYAHWHKGKAGRGYRLAESQLRQGASYAKRWLFNDAWAKQTLPFKTLIERFWPVPGWPENWEELVYGGTKTPGFSGPVASLLDHPDMLPVPDGSQLQIRKALYGINKSESINVRERLQSLVANNSLDIIADNSTLTPKQNPFRGKKKHLTVQYVFNGGEVVNRRVEEKEWLIIGQSARYVKGVTTDNGVTIEATDGGKILLEPVAEYRSATALNDLLIRKFKIPDRRLRGPMPIDLREFHRNDLAKLFAELGFTKGVEVGVAEGHYSEVLCKSIPNLELLCVDPWRRYSGNPWAHSQEHQDFSKAETERKLKGYNAKLIQDYSMNAVRDVPENSLDFCYIDGHHGFDWVMQDLIEWGKRVRSGGIIAGDDFYHFKKRWAGVVQAVQAYTDAHQISLWFLIDAPQSVDFFFVKP